MSNLAAVIFLAASSVPAAGGATHADEITAFASTMAIAKTVKESCPGIAPDDHFLELLRQRLHVANADRPAFVPQARAAADKLLKARDEAPTRAAWCDAVFRLYGPEGKLMRGLLSQTP